MADIKMTDFANETASTLDGNEYIIMADAAEGKKCTLTNLKTYLSKYFEPFTVDVTLNATSESTEKAGYNWLQTVTVNGVTAKHWCDAEVISGTYNGSYAVETVAGAIKLWFVTKPGTNVKVRVYYAETRT